MVSVVFCLFTGIAYNIMCVVLDLAAMLGSIFGILVVGFWMELLLLVVLVGMTFKLVYSFAACEFLMSFLYIWG